MPPSISSYLTGEELVGFRAPASALIDSVRDFGWRESFARLALVAARHANSGMDVSGELLKALGHKTHQSSSYASSVQVFAGSVTAHFGHPTEAGAVVELEPPHSPLVVSAGETVVLPEGLHRKFSSESTELRALTVRKKG